MLDLTTTLLNLDNQSSTGLMLGNKELDSILKEAAVA
jgi:hypothetical protein